MGEITTKKDVCEALESQFELIGIQEAGAKTLKLTVEHKPP